MDGIKLVLNAVLGLALFIGILYLAYISTKYIGKKYSINARGGKNLQIIETLSAGKDSRLVIAKAGNKILLLGMTAQNISLLKELDEDDIQLADEVATEKNTGETMSFAEALKINVAKKFGKDTAPKNKTEVKNNDKENVD